MSTTSDFNDKTSQVKEAQRRIASTHSLNLDFRAQLAGDLFQAALEEGPSSFMDVHEVAAWAVSATDALIKQLAVTEGGS